MRLCPLKPHQFSAPDPFMIMITTFSLIKLNLLPQMQKKNKMWKVVQFVTAIFFKSKCLLINSNQCQHSRHLMFSNIERAYDRLPKHLNSAITKLLYCFSRGEGGGAKNGRNAKIGKIPLENYIFRKSYWKCIWK